MHLPYSADFITSGYHSSRSLNSVNLSLIESRKNCSLQFFAHKPHDFDCDVNMVLPEKFSTTVYMYMHIR